MTADAALVWTAEADLDIYRNELNRAVEKECGKDRSIAGDKVSSEIIVFNIWDQETQREVSFCIGVRIEYSLLSITRTSRLWHIALRDFHSPSSAIG